ncbi:MAG TPA: CapA family protein, partial [Bacteroidales bacterium]|nr:CapA family protein [Bacteroidales bacterium]
GASIYLGHHPHIPQGIEKIGEGLAVYSLGDFVAPVHTEETRKTYFVKINLESDRVVGYEIVPCYITDDCQTVPAVSPRKEEIRAYIEELSCCINDGRSDEMHFKVAKSRFFSQYVRSWIEELRFGGPKVIFRKIRNFRYYHLQLIGRTIFGKLVGMGRKGVRQ